MLNVNDLRGLIDEFNDDPLFVTVSGAHLYGFPSIDSDVDLRGCHRLPLRQVLGLTAPDETLVHECHRDGKEIDLVSHEVRKYFQLLLKRNGYVLEQIFSPLVILGEEFLEQLRPLARRCLTRHHYHHYRGFLHTQRGLLEKQQPKQVKTLLYAYRITLTGIHLLRSGEVEANLIHLREHFSLPFLDELIAQKTAEKAPARDLNWELHRDQLQKLEAELDLAFQESSLPERPDREAVNHFLIDLRLNHAEDV